MYSTLFLLAVIIVSASAFRAIPSSRVVGSALNAIKVTVAPDEPLENVLKRFKKTVNQSGHLMDLRFKEQWETAADKRKRKFERARQLNRIERTNDKYERRFEGASEYNT